MYYIGIAIALYIAYLLIKIAISMYQLKAIEHGPIIDLPGAGRYFGLNVVGESFNTRNIARIDKQHGQPGNACFMPAHLIMETNNRHDKNAVRVEIAGLQVGHLSRADAKAYRQLIGATGTPNAVGRCEAKITHHGDDVWSVRLDTEV